MATLANTARKSSLGLSFVNLVQKLGRVLVVIAEAKSRQAEIARLNAMSDDQLAEKGLRRDEIVAHVFSDKFYA